MCHIRTHRDSSADSVFSRCFNGLVRSHEKTTNGLHATSMLALLSEQTSQVNFIDRQCQINHDVYVPLGCSHTKEYNYEKLNHTV